MQKHERSQFDVNFDKNTHYITNFNDHIPIAFNQHLQLIIDVFHPINVKEAMGVQWNQPQYQHVKHEVQELMIALNDMFQDNGAHHANDDTIKHVNGEFLDQEI